MATVWREPTRYEFQPPAQGFRWQVIRATSNRDVVPKTVNVLGRSSGEGGAAITLQVPGSIRVGPVCEQKSLFVKRLLVNLALDSRVDLVPQDHPVSAQLCVRQSFPERLAKAYEHLHRDVVLLKLTCRDRHVHTARCCGPSRGNTSFGFCQQ